MSQTDFDRAIEVLKAEVQATGSEDGAIAIGILLAQRETMLACLDKIRQACDALEVRLKHRDKLKVPVREAMATLVAAGLDKSPATRGAYDTIYRFIDSVEAVDRSFK